MPEKILSARKIAETSETLSRRVYERFPTSGLYKLSEALVELGIKAQHAAPKIARPFYSVRIAVGVLIAGVLGIVLSTIWAVLPKMSQISKANIIWLPPNHPRRRD
ncbi:MAG: hypothetical protein OEO71_06870 [Gammaproteobacteria bacterium]|nr:hypothetical protein [Gammaproteobacteria bacterium]